MGFYPLLLILLLALPAVGAIVVACLGSGRALLVRQISLGVTVAGAIASLVLAYGLVTERTGGGNTFRPVLVPGATAESPHKTTWNLIDFNMGRTPKTERNAPKLGAVQFFIGLDGMNVW